jgi:hypothetical protein
VAQGIYNTGGMGERSGMLRAAWLRNGSFAQNCCRDGLAVRLLLRVQPKCFELPTPFRRGVAQSRDDDASRQTAFDRSADELWSKKGERDGHVDMTDAATHARCDLLGVSDGA